MSNSNPQQNGPLLQIVKLSENAITPSKGSQNAAGHDLYSAENRVIPAKSRGIVKTDIRIKLPTGTYGRIAPRSGLAIKFQIDIGAGVIDEDYRGNVGVILINHSDDDFPVKKGDRIAQLICEKIIYPEIKVVEQVDSTKRGNKGFGSTDNK